MADEIKKEAGKEEKGPAKEEPVDIKEVEDALAHLNNLADGIKKEVGIEEKGPAKEEPIDFEEASTDEIEGSERVDERDSDDFLSNCYLEVTAKGYSVESPSELSEEITSSSEGSESPITATERRKQKRFQLSKIINKLVPKFLKLRRSKSVKRIHSIDIISEPLTHYSFGTGATYSDLTGKGIIDVVFVDPEIGYACVLDGAGHNKPEQKTKYAEDFEKFNRFYKDKIKKQQFTDSKEIKQFLENTIKQFVGLENTNNRLMNMPFSLAQLIELDGKKYVYFIQAGDCMTFINKKTGENFNNKLDNTNGSFGGTGTSGMTVNFKEVQSGDEIFGFSDGVGDYISEEDFQALIDNNTNRDTLLGEIQEIIVNKKTEGKQAINGKSELNIHDPNDSHHNEDISLFSFVVP